MNDFAGYHVRIVPSYPSKRVRMSVYFVILSTIDFVKLWKRQFVVQVKSTCAFIASL